MLEFEELHPKAKWTGIAAICPRCGDVIVSIYNKKPSYTHDFVTCTCKTTMVDNGGEYCRYGGDHIRIGEVKKSSKYKVYWNGKVAELDSYQDLVNYVKNEFNIKNDLNFKEIKVEVINE